MKREWLVGAAAGLCATSAALAGVTDVTVTVENLSPTSGTWLTPVWAGFHDGSFDLFNVGSAAPGFVERVAEDGNLDPLRATFASANGAFRDGVGMGPNAPQIAPGESTSFSVSVDGLSAANRYMSFISMVIPSNDAFIGNEDPASLRVFDDMGNFTPFTLLVLGTDVRDAGTEVNDELPMNTAFFGQMTPDTGVTENGVVMMHPGYMGSIGNPGTPMILADPMFVNADFTASGYVVARITVVPAPAALGLLAGGGLLALRRRR